MNRTSLVRAAPAIALAVLVLAPFHDKAFTIDDPIFLMEARQLLSDPLHPTAFDIVWSDVPSRASLANGPIMAWLLVPSVLAGGAEWLAHAAVIATLAAALWATVSLALRLGLQPGAATIAALLLAATPAALAMAGTVMPDILAMALGTLGLERLVTWQQERRASDGVLGAILLGLAPLARPHTVLLLAIGALLLVGDVFTTARWRASRWTLWLPVVAAPIVSLILIVVMRDPAPGAPSIVSAPSLISGSEYIASNVLAFLTHWSMTIPLALPWVLLRPAQVLGRWWVPLLGALSAGLALALLNRASIPVALVVGVSIAVLWDILADALKRRDALQLILGMWLFVGLAPAPYPHLPSKYLLVAAPAAAILVARAMAECLDLRARVTLGLTVALGLALGVAILRTDAAFADLGRRAARELIAPNVAAGHRVWFAGHWGFQWYAENAGGRVLSLTPPYPIRGDLVVTCRNTEPGDAILTMLEQRYPVATLLGRTTDATPGGRIMHGELGAGFFSNEWGYLPLAWGDDALDTFHLWRIE